MDGKKREAGVEGIAAIPDLVERACRMRNITRDRNTLTSAEARTYWSVIATLHGKYRLPAKWIAAQVGISRGRVWQIVGLHALATKSDEVSA